MVTLSGRMALLAQRSKRLATIQELASRKRVYQEGPGVVGRSHHSDSLGVEAHDDPAAFGEAPSDEP